MKKLMALFAITIVGAALIGCGAKEEPAATDTGKNTGTMEEKADGASTTETK